MTDLTKLLSHLPKNKVEELERITQRIMGTGRAEIVVLFAHYNPYEHNLEVLRNRTLLIDRRVKNVLPYESAEQQEFFDTLNFAYIGGRYRSEEEFPVTQEQLDYWSKEAGKLLVLTETICKERMECLK